MKLKQFVDSIFHRGEIVARFGAATLIKAPQGQWQLMGGTTSLAYDSAVRLRTRLAVEWGFAPLLILRR